MAGKAGWRVLMKNIDLRLLAVIRELQRTGSVSHTAEHLGLSQSAVSMTLARLRDHFGDPLFVRTSSGMATTPYAADLINDLNRAADLLETALDRRMHFDPATADRMFRLCSTDIAQFTILPRLVKRLTAAAPAARVDLRQLSESTARMLETGDIDLAIGLIPPMGAGFCQEKLFSSHFVCVARPDHPRVRSQLSLEQFQAESHVSITTAGAGYHAIERTIEALGIHRRIGMRIPSFLGIAAVIAATDLLAIVPASMGQMVSGGAVMKVLPLPFSLPGYDVTQNWHERFALDPALMWLRSMMQAVFREERGDALPAAAADKPKTGRKTKARLR
jgi:DNA-binding transcriptional LysR family regulator